MAYNPASRPQAWLKTPLLLLSLILATLLICSACSSTQPKEITIITRTPIYTGQIFIGGAVNNPGFYPLKSDDRLEDLIQAAGGLKSGADSAQVKLYIPQTGEGSLPQKIDINRAEAWLLAALPGIGDTHAQDIVSYRQQNGPFRNINDLLKVKGIGPATLDRIKELITVSDDAYVK